jgi:hypothetical protein
MIDIIKMATVRTCDVDDIAVKVCDFIKVSFGVIQRNSMFLKCNRPME